MVVHQKTIVKSWKLFLSITIFESKIFLSNKYLGLVLLNSLRLSFWEMKKLEKMSFWSLPHVKSNSIKGLTF